MTWKKKTSQEYVISHNNNIRGQKSICNVKKNMDRMLKINNVQGFQKINTTFDENDVRTNPLYIIHGPNESTLEIIKLP